MTQLSYYDVTIRSEWTGKIIESTGMSGDGANERFEEKGNYTFGSGSTYVGGMKNAIFEGQGTLHFSENGSYTGTFENGIAKEGSFHFSDGLTYEPVDEWKYCDGKDNRMFQTESKEGLKPAGRSQLTNRIPSLEIPEGMYDCGDGFYDPQKRVVYNYSMEFLRSAGADEHKWITERCRKAWEENVGLRRIH